MAKRIYRLWCIRPQKRIGYPEDTTLLLVGLGTRKDCADRWRWLVDKEENMPLNLMFLVRRCLRSPRYVRIMLYGEYATRKEAIAIMQNLKCQNKLLPVEDWT